MFRSFAVRNFRCFQELAFSPLERVNLIGGKNNVGKTALLEALFLHVGANSPLVPLNVNVFRGIEQTSTDLNEVWGWLFFRKRTENPIELVSTEASDLRRTLKVSLAEPLTTTITPAISGRAAPKNGASTSDRAAVLSSTGLGPSVLTLSYEDTAGRTTEASAAITREGDLPSLRVSRSSADVFPMSIFLSTRYRSPVEDATRFSKALEMGREDELLERLQILDPSLRRLMVLIIGGVPMISGVVGTGPPVPLPLMGEGMVRLLSILLAIGEAPGGVVLIDEIENGLHYSTLVGVWRAIGEAAQRSDTQIFATTHSWECIVAAHEAFHTSGRDAPFRFFRLERRDGEIRTVPYDAEMLAAAFATGLEVR
jgi:hypothetical protein